MSARRVMQSVRYEYKMKLRILSIILLLLVTACSGQKHNPIGLESFNALIEVAKKVHTSGDQNLLFTHSDFSEVPKKKIEEIKKTLGSWNGMHPNMRLKSIEVIDPDRYDPYAFMPKDWDDDFKKMFKPAIWNIKPEKLIMFTEEPKDPEKGMKIRWIFGAFKKNNLWYFSTQYYE